MGPDLTSERCLPYEEGTAPLSGEEARALLSGLDARWHLAEDGRALTRQVDFKTCAHAMAFLNRLAEIGEREGHHPDFCLMRWNQVGPSLTTHAIGRLSRNDFVLATKLQAVIKPLPEP